MVFSSVNRLRQKLFQLAKNRLFMSTFGQRGANGQSTVEFAIVAGGFMVVVIGLASMWRAASSGLFVEHALSVASHHLQQVIPAAIGDIFLY